ncbi:uncharacterized protein TNCV_3515301 [Trichonephila clavipes]|nr:uncharacterized protein TNCV_3515301 [Trichonephila clavipes]
MFVQTRRMPNSPSQVTQAMTFHTITQGVRAACHCKAKAGLRRSPPGSPHTNTIVITPEIESGFVAKENPVPFPCSPVSSCVAPLETEASMGGH